MILTSQNAEEIIKMTEPHPLVIYGMGYVGGFIAKWCEENRVAYVYADRLAEEKKRDTAAEVVLPEQLKQLYPGSVIVVASINYFDEIRSNLKQMGFCDEQIVSYLCFWSERISWEELEETADWDKVRQRAGIFAKWITPSAESVADYGYEKNFLKEFLPEGMKYEAPDYIRIQGNALVADFGREGAAIYTDAAFGMAILMSFLNPEEVIEHLCRFTRKEIIISYVPFDMLNEAAFRRSIHYHNDYTEEELLTAFSERGFSLVRKEADPFDAVNIVYMFEKNNR